jgi:hypothetical protein
VNRARGSGVSPGINAPLGYLVLAVDALGVDLEQYGDAMPGPLPTCAITCCQRLLALVECRGRSRRPFQSFTI